MLLPPNKTLASSLEVQNAGTPEKINQSAENAKEGEQPKPQDQLLLELTPKQMALVKALNICDYKALISPPLQVYGESIPKAMVTNDGNEEVDEPSLASDRPHDDQETAFKHAVNDHHVMKRAPSKCAARGFGVNLRITDDGITPLMLACTIGDLDIVKLLCTCKELDLNRRDDAGITATYIAAYYGHKDVFLFLVSKGALVRPNNK